MRLARFKDDERARVGIVEDGRIGVLPMDDLATALSLSRLEIERAVTDWRPLDEARLLAPVTPRTVIGVGLNHAGHARETGRPVTEWPALFVRPSGTVAPPHGTIAVSPVSDTLDYEGELAVVMGCDGVIAGYTVVNDITLRAFARPETLPLAKGLPGSLPCGPWVVTADAIDPAELTITTWVNGERRQHGRTRDMIRGCAELVAWVGRVITLGPGDLICTGSPAGSGAGMTPPRFLRAGDTVRVEIDGIGAVETRIL